MRKLKELFQAGAVRLIRAARAPSCSISSIGATCCATRSTTTCPPIGERSATAKYAVAGGRDTESDFHSQFGHFINQVALFWRDKRNKQRGVHKCAYDPRLGSVREWSAGRDWTSGTT